MEACIFCKIIKGEIPSHKVYEDDVVYAFLDVHPINPGHLLVIPKHHEPDLYRLENEIYQPLMMSVKNLSAMVEKKIQPKKVGLVVSGWDVPHAHVHIIPMYNSHDITSQSAIEGKKANPSVEELAAIAQLLLG